MSLVDTLSLICVCDDQTLNWSSAAHWSCSSLSSSPSIVLSFVSSIYTNEQLAKLSNVMQYMKLDTVVSKSFSSDLCFFWLLLIFFSTVIIKSETFLDQTHFRAQNQPKYSRVRVGIRGIVKQIQCRSGWFSQKYRLRFQSTQNR